MTMERWRPVIIKGVIYPGYEVSDIGRVRSYRRLNGGGGVGDGPPHLLKPTISDMGYLVVGLMRERRVRIVAVHQLVMEAFEGPVPPGFQVYHGLGGKLNNNLANLFYHRRGRQDVG